MVDMNRIEIEEIPVEESNAFFEKHIIYLIEDKIIFEKDDIDYFSGEEYRNTLQEYMIRKDDKHHMVYFKEYNQIIGAAQYTTYQSEDGKCFILDFWIFPEYRGKGKGKKCFSALENHTKKDGALYYQLNSMKKESIKFWESLGFVYDGDDEYNIKLFTKRIF